MSENEKKEKPEKAKKENKPKKEKAAKTKVCPSCKAEIPKNAKLCPHCAAKQPKKFPVVIAAVLAAVLLLAGLSVSVFVFHFPIDPPFELPFGKALSETELGQTMEVTSKQEEAILAVFEQCGIYPVREVKRLVSDDESATYAINDAETVHFPDTKDAIIVELNNKDKTVQSIDFQKHAVYRNGTVVAQATDFYLSSAQRDHYLSMCLTAVNARLPLPETASYPAKSGWNYTSDGDKVTVESTVTTKDANGTPVTQAFTVEFEEGEFVSVSIEAPVSQGTDKAAGETGND